MKVNDRKPYEGHMEVSTKNLTTPRDMHIGLAFMIWRTNGYIEA